MHLSSPVTVFLAFLLTSLAMRSSAWETPLCPSGHAHNDYQHERPLFEALDQGFLSVEADVWLVDGKLLVAHDRDEVQEGRTLESLYLEPLRKRVLMNKGHVHLGGAPFTLLIDFKSSAGPTYQALKSRLKFYDSILTKFEQGNIHQGPITVVISGNRPIAEIQTESIRHVAIDGRINDLTNLPPKDLMPLISDNWNKHFSWRGKGEMPANEIEKLRNLIEQVHEHDRRLRLWSAPDLPASWILQHQLGVDLINTDQLRSFAHYLDSLSSTGPK
ncbi:MAG: phosphatidylinositol-specific phospholipase C/glycerophosphodiester phosphodiesterase family protein [Verrucomicrobiales bacterium]